MARNNYAYRQLTSVVSGAVVDAFKNHPDYLTPKGRRSAKTSIVKRVAGTVLSFAVQAAEGRPNHPATSGAQPHQVVPQVTTGASGVAGAGVLRVSPSPHCRIVRVKLKPSPAEIALRDENIALGAQVFALECVLARLRRPQPRDEAGRFVSQADITRQRLSRLVSTITPEQRAAAKLRGEMGREA